MFLWTNSRSINLWRKTSLPLQDPSSLSSLKVKTGLGREGDGSMCCYDYSLKVKIMWVTSLRSGWHWAELFVCFFPSCCGKRGSTEGPSLPSQVFSEHNAEKCFLPPLWLDAAGVKWGLFSASEIYKLSLHSRTSHILTDTLIPTTHPQIGGIAWVVIRSGTKELLLRLEVWWPMSCSSQIFGETFTGRNGRQLKFLINSTFQG